MKKEIDFSQLEKIRALHQNKKIVHCHGVFDLFHNGHLHHLQSAKEYGDILVVTVTPDIFVNKGPLRPAFNQNKRAKMLAALELVDYVAININKTAVPAIQLLRPNYFVKGAEYSRLEDDITGGIFEEKKALEAFNGLLVFSSGEVDSSTRLINTYFSSLDDEQKRVIDKIKTIYKTEEVIDIIKSIGQTKVLVAGEPIIDQYIFCRPENLSSKSPTVSANFINEEFYPGGVWAVASHLSALGCSVTMIAPYGIDGKEIAKSVSHKGGITDLSVCIESLKTPRKIRYISPFLSQRIFELTHLDNESWARVKLDDFNELIKKESAKNNLTLILDFGHGLWEFDRLDSVNQINSFTSINVQSNSGNYGFNLFHKHKKYDYLVLDERELRLGMHDRFSSVEKLLNNARSKILCENFSVTLGTSGSMVVEVNGRVNVSPVYFDQPIDTTGAGDAYFAITSLLMQKECNPLLIAFIGNIYAGLKTKIIGNKEPVILVSLIKAVKALLG